MTKVKRPIKLEDLANGNLPEHLTTSIGKLKITVEELNDWKKSHPPLYIAFKQGHFILDLRIRWSINKFLVFLGGIVGLVWAFMKFFLDYLPIIKEWLSKT